MTQNATGPSDVNEGVAAHYVTINGLHMYYEVHGTGRPLVLLHGGFMSVGAWGSLLPALAATRQVIAIEMEGHGHTADLDRPLRFEQMADDVAGLIEQVGIGRADLLGYSLGGNVALQTAIRRPEVVGKLVVVSAPPTSEGWYPKVRAGMSAMKAEVLAATPLYDVYLAAAPQPEHWPALVAKMRRLLTEQPYDWTHEIATLQAPTLIVVGDADNIRPESTLEMFRLLGGGKEDGDMAGLPRSQLAVLPGATHLSMLAHLDLLLPIVTSFLDAPTPQAG